MGGSWGGQLWRLTVWRPQHLLLIDTAGNILCPRYQKYLSSASSSWLELAEVGVEQRNAREGVFYDPKHSPADHFNHSSNSAWYWLTIPLSHPFPHKTQGGNDTLITSIRNSRQSLTASSLSYFTLSEDTQLPLLQHRAHFISGCPGVILDVGSMSREADLCLLPHCCLLDATSKTRSSYFPSHTNEYSHSLIQKHGKKGTQFMRWNCEWSFFSRIMPLFLQCYLCSIENSGQDFIGSAVVKTLCFHCRGHGFDPGRATKILVATARHGNKRKKIKERNKYSENNSFLLHTLNCYQGVLSSIYSPTVGGKPGSSVLFLWDYGTLWTSTSCRKVCCSTKSGSLVCTSVI